MFRKIPNILARSKSIQQRWTSTSASIGRKIESSQELDTFFENSTWSTSEFLIKEKLPIEISNEVLDRLLELSGLSKEISLTERTAIIESLTEQLNFITKLHNVTLPDNSSTITRLVDDKSVEPLTFDKLMENISNTTPDLSKGEIENSWNPISLASEHEKDYFRVKEGLLKKNK